MPDGVNAGVGDSCESAATLWGLHTSSRAGHICFCRRFIFRRFKSMKPAIESGIKASCSAVYRVCRIRMAAAIRKFSEDGDSQHLRVLPVRTFPYDNASFHNTRRGPIPCTALFWYFYALFQDGGGVVWVARAPAREQKKSSRPKGRLLRWSEWRDLNPRHPAPKAGALPAALHPVIYIIKLIYYITF